MKKILLNKLWLRVGMIVAIMTTALSTTVWAEDYEELFTIAAGSVISGTKYQAHTGTVNGRDYVVTFGGNNNSIGTNSNNRSSCNLSKYAKYAVSPVTTSSVASAFACLTSITDVSRITYTFNGGKNQTNTNVYLLYSSDNITFSQVALTSGTQGATISSGTEYIFDSKTGYFALLFEATNSSGDWRIDAVNMKLYKTSGSSSTLASIVVDASGATNVFHVGDTFTHDGAVVTATYEDESTKDVTANATFSTPDMTTAGTKEVTVGYTENNVEKTTSYNIEVKAPISITLSGTYPTEFNQGDTFSHEGIVITANYDGATPKDVTEAATFSTPDMTTIGTKTVTVAYGGLTTTYNITVNEYVQPTEFDINLNNALFGTSYNGSASGITDTNPVSGTLNGVIVTYAGSGNHYINDSQIRFYPSNKLSFEAPDGYMIKSIVFSSAGTWAATISANSGTYNASTKTWTGETNTVLFTGSGSSRCDMSKVTITLEVVVPVETHILTIANPENVIITATYGGGEDAPVLQNGENGEVEEGTEVMIALTVTSGYVFESLTITGAEEGQTITPIPVPNAEGVYTFIMPAYNVTVSASVVEYVAPAGSDYVRITSLDQLVNGAKVIIAARYNEDNATAYSAMKSTTSGKPESVNFTSVTVDGNETIPTTISNNENDYYWIVNVTNDGYTFTNANNAKIGYKGTGTDFQTNGDNTTWTIERSTSEASTMVGGYTGFVIKNGNTNARAFAYNGTAYGAYATTNMSAGGYNFFLDFFVVAPETESVSVSALKYSTYASDNALDFTGSSIKAFYATIDEGGSTLIFHEITKVPAGTGVLLYSANGAVTENVLVCTGETDAADGNLFVRGTGAAVSYSDTEFNYVLSKPQGDNLGFYKANNNTVATNRAYIQVPVSGVKSFSINLDDDPTGISTVDNEQWTMDNVIYNLAGQRLQKMQKGINIVNGKKIAIK